MMQLNEWSERMNMDNDTILIYKQLLEQLWYRLINNRYNTTTYVQLKL